MITKEELAEEIKKIKSMVEELPSPYKEIAFRVLLEKALEKEVKTSVRKEEERIDVLFFPLMPERLTLKEKILFVLREFWERYKKKGVGAKLVHQVLKEKYALPTTPASVSMRLIELVRENKVTRLKGVKGYEYHITSKGKEALEQAIRERHA